MLEMHQSTWKKIWASARRLTNRGVNQTIITVNKSAGEKKKNQLIKIGDKSNSIIFSTFH